MWWKVIVFCLLVCAVLFVVLSSITGAPTAMFFHRCCEDGIENDDVILETFRHNFLRERLVMEEVEYVEEIANVEDSTPEEHALPESTLNSVEVSDTTHTSRGELATDEAVTPESDLNNIHIDISKVTHKENNNDSEEIPFNEEVNPKLDFDVKEELDSTI